MQYQDIDQFLADKAGRFGDRPALGMHGSDEAFSYSALAAQSARLASAFSAGGLAADDRVAILCDSRPRWGLAFFATLRAGGVFLPLDAGLGADELARIIDEARPRFLLVADAYRELAVELDQRASHTVELLSLEAGDGAQAWPSIDSLTGDQDLGQVRRHPDDAALLTYTSGTMGSSKGVITTHGNLLFQVYACDRVFHEDEQCSTVSILPLSHLFEIATGFLGILNAGGRVTYCNSLLPTEVLSAVAAERVTCMITVPLFLNLLKQAISSEVRRQSTLRQAVFRTALAIAPVLPQGIRRRLFARVHERLGGRCRHFVAGGAPLDARTERFFSRVGLPVYQGYGMAEASPVIASNGPGANRRGSVGRALPGVEVRVDTARGHEILTRGPHVMKGYFGKPAETREVVDERGWLRTGDIGRIDADGYLFVAGRKKNVIVLGSGKKVQPETIESTLFAHADIAEGCVVGATARRGILDGSEEVCAIVVPHADLLASFDGRSDELCRYLRGIVNERSAELPRWQRPTRTLVRLEPLPRTATRKVRRPQVCRWASTEVASC